MNKANLLRVADAIEKHEIKDLGFNMADYVAEDAFRKDRTGHGCKTTACIAGTAVTLAQPRPRFLADPVSDARAAIRAVNRLDIAEEAMMWLDLTDDQASRLFSGRPRDCPFLDVVSPRHAVRTLRYAAEHGVIDWDAANPPEAS